MSAGFQEGGGEGGGGGGPVYPGGGGESSKYGVLQGLFGSSGETVDPWDSPRGILSILRLPISVAVFRSLSKARKDYLHRAAKNQFLRERRGRRDVPIVDLAYLAQLVAAWFQPAVEPAVSQRQRRAEEQQAEQRAERADRVPPFVFPRIAAPADRVYSTQPRGGTTRLPGTLQQSAFEELRAITELLAQWWQQREELKAQQRAARDARRAEISLLTAVRESQRGFPPQQGEGMALGDILSGIGGSLSGALTALAPVATSIYQARAAREMRRGAMTGASGVPLQAFVDQGMFSRGPLVGAAGGVLGAFLGEEPGTLETGGMLERLGLEGDLERTATFWERTRGGFRPVRELNAVHPTTGRIGAWTYRGRPLMYTGDLAICRDVQRVARRAASKTGLRFRRRGRR